MKYLLLDQEIKQRNKAFNKSFSYAVSKVRQPIEPFFNWLNEKTKKIKVRRKSNQLPVTYSFIRQNVKSFHKSNILNSDPHY